MIDDRFSLVVEKTQKSNGKTKKVVLVSGCIDVNQSIFI